MRDFKVWEQVEPPRGTVYHYPPRADQVTWMAGAPAPANIAQQMYVQAIQHQDDRALHAGRRFDRQDDRLGRLELEGYMRS